MSLTLCSCSIQNNEVLLSQDSDLELNDNAHDHLSEYIYSIREGATSPAKSGGSGGCGCN